MRTRFGSQAGRPAAVGIAVACLLLVGWTLWTSDSREPEANLLEPPLAVLELVADGGTAPDEWTSPGGPLEPQRLGVPSSVPPAEGTEGPVCQVSLRVTDQEGRPIPEAQLTHGPAYALQPTASRSWAAANGTWSRAIPTIEGQHGWRIEASAPGRTPQALIVPFLPEGDLALGDLRIAAGIRIEGQVLSMDGIPLADARVLAVGVRRSVSHSARRTMSETARSDRRGHFVLQLEEVPHNYDVHLAAWHPVEGGPFEKGLGHIAEHASVTLRFGPSSTVRGRVTMRDGTPLPNAVVLPTLSPRFALGEVETDMNGTYDFPLASGERARLTYRAEGFVVLDSEPFEVTAPARDVDLLMVRESRLLVDARNALTGAPIPNAAVSFCSDSWGYSRCHDAEATNGLLEVPELPPGLWSRLTVSAPGYHAEALQDLIVAEGEIVGPLLVRLLPRATNLSVSGRVLGLGGKPVAGASVSARLRQHDDRITPFTATSTDSGAYRIDSLSAGDLLLVATDGRDNRSDAVHGQLAPPGWSDIDLRLHPPATLEGSAWLRPGQPASGALLRLDPVLQSALADPRGASTVSDALGSFLFKVPPGRYRLSAWHPSASGDVALEAPRFRLELKAGGLRRIDVPLTLPALLVTGRVLTDQDTTGWSLSWRFAQDALDTNDWIEQLVQEYKASVSPRGEYRLDGVRPGLYSARVSRPDGSVAIEQPVLVAPSLNHSLTVDLAVNRNGR